MSVRALTIGCLMLVLGGASTPAEDDSFRRQLTDYLSSCWNTADLARSLADTKFAELKKTAGDEPRVFYGHSLVMLYQRRYLESADALNHVLLLDKDHLPALRARVWLALLVKKYGDALTAMEDLAEAVGRLTADNREANEAARFLGSTYGFVDGPLSETAALADRGSTQTVILDHLDEEQRRTFTEARQAVMEKFTSLTTERANSRESAIADDEAEKQKVLVDVDKRRDQMQTQADELKERRSKIEAELKEELAEIAKLDRPLTSQLASLQADGSAIQASADGIAIDIARLEDRLAAEKDPGRRDLIRSDINRLAILLRRYDLELAALNTAIAGVQGERATLFVRQKTAERNLGGQLQAIDRQVAGFAAEGRKLAGIERKARRPSTGSTGKVNGLGMTATALKTYEPFPIERERQRLLESLK